MKKIIFTGIIYVASLLTGFSQHLFLSNDHGKIANGSLIVESGVSDTDQVLTWLHIYNRSSATMQVLMKKEEISMLPGTTASICWAGYCYGEETKVSLFPLLMQPGDSAEGCFGHFAPYGCRGISSVRWTFFNQANPNDSTSLTVHYSFYPAATGEKKHTGSSLNIINSSSFNNIVTVKYSIPSQKTGRIEIHDAGGRILYATPAEASTGTASVRTSGFSPGLYFISLVCNETTIIKKIIIQH